MLKRACLRFRREFEPSQPEGHEAACGPCAAWAREVEAFRGLGVDLPLPPALRGRLGAHLEQGAEPGTPFVRESLPQVPVPADLLARLHRIPAESRMARAARPVTSRSGEMVAASFLFAIVLTLGIRSSLPPADHQALAAASRVTGAILEEAGNRGTRSLLHVGQDIFDGCLSANRSLENLLDRIGEPRRESPASPQAPAASPAPSHTRKETHHGSR